MIEWISTNMPDVYRIGWEGTNSWSDAFSATIYMTGWSFCWWDLGLMGCSSKMVQM